MTSHPRYFAVLDPARDERIAPAIARLAPRAERLLRAGGGEAARKVAPLCFEFEADGPVAHFWRKEGRAASWGVAFEATCDFAEMLAHLRCIRLACLPWGATVVFRFWDPRVLAVYFEHADMLESARVFGPASRILSLNEAGQEMAWPRPSNAAPEYLAAVPISERLWDAFFEDDARRFRRRVAGDIATQARNGITPAEALAAAERHVARSSQLGLNSEREAAAYALAAAQVGEARLSRTPSFRQAMAMPGAPEKLRAAWLTRAAREAENS